MSAKSFCIIFSLLFLIFFWCLIYKTMLHHSDKAVLQFGKILHINKNLVSYLYETVTFITTKGKERKMPGIFVDIKLRTK